MHALTFHAFLLPEIEKLWTLKKNWDPKSEKGPHGDPGPQMGTHVATVHFGQNDRETMALATSTLK